MEEFRFEKSDLRFLVRLKARDFRVINKKTVSEKQIREYLFNVKWKKREKMQMCEIVDDIMTLDLSDVFDYLSIQVIKEASKLSIHDFNEFISK